MQNQSPEMTLCLSPGQILRFQQYEQTPEEFRLLRLGGQEVARGLILANVSEETLGQYLPRDTNVANFYKILQSLPAACRAHPEQVAPHISGHAYFPTDYPFEYADIVDQIIIDFCVGKAMSGHYQREHHEDGAQAYEISWQWLFLAAKCSPRYAFVALRELPLETLEEQPNCHRLFQSLLMELCDQPDLSPVNRILLTMTLWRYVDSTKNLEELQKTAYQDNINRQIAIVIQALKLADTTLNTEMRLAFGNTLLSNFFEDTETFYIDTLGKPHPETAERDTAQDVRDLEGLQAMIVTPK